MYSSLGQPGVMNLNDRVKLSERTRSAGSAYVIHDGSASLGFGKKMMINNLY